MGTFSIWHWIVVLVIVVLVFGTKKLRNLGGDLGSAVKGFKEGMKDSNSENNASDTADSGSLPFDNEQENSSTQNFKDADFSTNTTKTTQNIKKEENE